jgi:hypothetical protein
MRLRPSPRRAYLGNTLVEDYLRPKAEDKVRFGFYDLLLHSLATFLVSSGTDPKTVRTLRTRSQEGNFERLHWTRVTTGIAVTLAWVGSGGKNDVCTAGPVAGGAVAFRPLGIITGLAVRPQANGYLMSAYGGTRSIYMNFFGRGRDISFPRDTAMDIGFGSRTAAPMPTSP